MPAKAWHVGPTARSDIQRGIDKRANAVKITRGPRGATWSWRSPMVRRCPPRMA